MVIHLPKGSKTNNPKKIVIHAMAEYIDNSHAVIFLNKIGLSAHSLITPTGENIRCRQDFEGAYHAKNHNKDSLGVEILVPGNHTYSTFLNKIETNYISDIQYSTLLNQVREWIQKFGITEIVRHSDIDPTRKKDPGSGLDWERFKGDL